MENGVSLESLELSTSVHLRVARESVFVRLAEERRHMKSNP
jgi:hypothetical protein